MHHIYPIIMWKWYNYEQCYNSDVWRGGDSDVAALSVHHLFSSCSNMLCPLGGGPGGTIHQVRGVLGDLIRPRRRDLRRQRPRGGAAEASPPGEQLHVLLLNGTRLRFPPLFWAPSPSPSHFGTRSRKTISKPQYDFGMNDGAWRINLSCCDSI